MQALHRPINIVAGPNTPTIAELEQLGVARASLASGLMRATLGYLQRVARELLERGTYNSLSEGAISGTEFRTLFRKEARGTKRDPVESWYFLLSPQSLSLEETGGA